MKAIKLHPGFDVHKDCTEHQGSKGGNTLKRGHQTPNIQHRTLNIEWEYRVGGCWAR